MHEAAHSFSCSISRRGRGRGPTAIPEIKNIGKPFIRTEASKLISKRFRDFQTSLKDTLAQEASFQRAVSNVEEVKHLLPEAAPSKPRCTRESALDRRTRVVISRGTQEERDGNAVARQGP